MSSNPIARAFAAIAAGASALFSVETSSRREAEEPAEPSPALPNAADLIEGFEEPLLLVRNRRVLLANSAALSVLGDHIVDADVRLAIRHPAAAERLTSETAEPGRVELVGLGDHERRWEMDLSVLPGDLRLVHLTDRSRAHAAERMRTDFVANASHELRTPLATLLGFLETLQDEQAAGDPELRSRFISIMFDEAKRMHRLVDDLISLSRIEAERFTVPRTPVPLLPLIEQVRTSCGNLLDARKGRLLVESGLDEPVVPGDSTQLFQLLQNLMINALKYGREGSDVLVRIEALGADMLRVSVIDEGEGIPAEHIPRLTERFYRVDPGRSRSIGGTGLGLAIVKHIAQRHRGRLDIRSVVGQGTTVTVDLPRLS